MCQLLSETPMCGTLNNKLVFEDAFEWFCSGASGIEENQPKWPVRDFD